MSDVERAIRTGCNATGVHLTCSYPECKCKQIPTAIKAALAAAPQGGSGWRTIDSEPADNSEIWLSNGKDVWLGTAHSDGSLKLPTRSECRFWCPANKPSPPQQAADHEGG